MLFHRLVAHAAALPLVLGLGCIIASLPGHAREEVGALVDQLVEVNSPNTFYAGTFRFTEFPPLDEAPLASHPLPADAGPGPSAFRALIRLVELGPVAMPALLAHLDDARPTRTVIPDDLAKSMGTSAYVDYRPGDPCEEEAIKSAALPFDNPGPDFDGLVADYTLTVGDMCFVLLGMITNRSYYVVVDEFEAQLNSPTRSARIVTALREMWGSNPRPTDLYARLKEDLEQDDLRFAISAATRLLYYFPSLSDNLIVARFASLAKAHEPGSEDLADYLLAISWSTNPRVVSALRRFLDGATDASQIAAAARVHTTAPDLSGHQELMTLTDRLKLRRDPSFVEATRNLLELNLLTYPAQRYETVSRFLDGAGAYASTSACIVCETLDDPPVAALARLLSNRSRSTGERYLIKGARAEQWPEDDDYLPYRICDRAYETISHLLGNTEAVAIGTYEEMDARIEELVRRLTGPPAGWAFSPAELKARQQSRHERRKEVLPSPAVSDRGSE